MQVLLALPDSMGRIITSKWLQKNGVCTTEASEWNGLTQTLRELFHASSVHNNGFDAYYRVNDNLKAKLVDISEMKNPTFVIVVDIGLLDLSTDIWKEQLNFLREYFGKAKFAWLLNHDTPNTIKMELRRKGHILMVNKPLYKAKMVHILDAVIKERNLDLQKKNTTVKESDVHESLEIDSAHSDAASSDTSDISDMGSSNPIDKERECIAKSHPSSQNQIKNCLVGLTDETSLEDNDNEDAEPKVECIKEASFPREIEGEESQKVRSSSKAVNGKKSLEGLRILLAEDTPVLQRVATIMLEKMGARVVAVGDGQQAVNALNSMLTTEDCRKESLLKQRSTRTQTQILSCPPYDLILMDCQVRFMECFNLYFSHVIKFFSNNSDTLILFFISLTTYIIIENLIQQTRKN